MEEKTIGLLLQTIVYLGKKKILKVLTPEHGLISFISNSSKHPTDPFCVGEWAYRKNQRELYPLIDASLLDPLIDLRQSLASLQAAGSIAQDLLRTQMPNKPAEGIFQLACLYLKKLPLQPQMLAASFRLKLLFHEGLLSTEQESLFTEEEWGQISTLAFSRKLSEIIDVKAAPFQKIEILSERLF